jgi:hypothetical protein
VEVTGHTDLLPVVDTVADTVVADTPLVLVVADTPLVAVVVADTPPVAVVVADTPPVAVVVDTPLVAVEATLMEYVPKRHGSSKNVRTISVEADRVSDTVDQTLIIDICHHIPGRQDLIAKDLV